MTHNELVELLETTSLPIAYGSFEAPPAMPFLVFLRTNSDNISADDKVWAKKSNYRIELYTKIKNEATERKIEAALDSAEIYYETYEARIESENAYQVAYEIQI